MVSPRHLCKAPEEALAVGRKGCEIFGDKMNTGAPLEQLFY